LAINSETDAVATFEASAASAAATTNENVPPDCGVPAIVPVAPSSARPAGSEPDATAQAKAPLPPAASSAAEYATVARPAGSADVPMVTG
jgi:hypothetical protein